MSSLLRKEALESVGGMAPFGEYLAEDFFFASRMSAKGWLNAVASMPALQNHVSEVAKFQDRICRSVNQWPSMNRTSGRRVHSSIHCDGR